MFFLYPLVLLAAGFILVPIFLHFFSLRKVKKVYFSDVSLLKKINSQNKSKASINNWLLFFLRVLLILLLIFLFAQPSFFTEQKQQNSSQKIILYIDNSPNMETFGQKGTLLDLAKNDALEILKDLPENSEICLLSNNPWDDFSFKASSFIEQEIQQIEIGSFSQSLATFEAKIKQHFRQDTSLIIYYFSDFHTKKIADFLPDPHLHYIWKQYLPAASDNISVDTLYFVSPFLRVNQEHLLQVKLSNHGSAAVEKIPVKLYLNGQLRQFQEVSIAGKQQIDLSFNYTPDRLGWQEGKISLSGDAFPFDNQLFFTYQVIEQKKILFLFDDNSDQYLEKLIAIESSIHADWQNIHFADINTFSVYNRIVLQGVHAVSPYLLEKLSDYVKNGGHLVIIPSKKQNLSDFNQFIQQLGLKVNLVDYSGKILTEEIGFSSSFYQNAFTDITTFDPLKVKPLFTIVPTTDSPHEILLYMNKQNLLQRFWLKKGQLFLFSFPLDLDSNANNFSVHPIFIPTILNIFLQENHPFPLYHNTQAADLSFGFTGDASMLTFFREHLQIFPKNKLFNQQIHLSWDANTSQPGIFRIIQKDHVLIKLAVNSPRSISTVRYANPFSESFFHKKTANNFKNKAHNINILYLFFCLISVFLLLLETFILKNLEKSSK